MTSSRELSLPVPTKTRVILPSPRGPLHPPPFLSSRLLLLRRGRSHMQRLSVVAESCYRVVALGANEVPLELRELERGGVVVVWAEEGGGGEKAGQHLHTESHQAQLRFERERGRTSCLLQTAHTPTGTRTPQMIERRAVRFVKRKVFQTFSRCGATASARLGANGEGSKAPCSSSSPLRGQAVERVREVSWVARG